MDFLILPTFPETFDTSSSCTCYMAETHGKYSLQGTTQGNGLTGGVPPIRFSM